MVPCCTIVGHGLATACDTLGAQAYGGKHKKLVGLAMQRGFWILGLACLPCWAIFLNAESIVRLASIDPNVARLTGRYCLVSMPMLPGSFLYALFQRYLQVQVWCSGLPLS